MQYNTAVHLHDSLPCEPVHTKHNKLLGDSEYTIFVSKKLGNYPQTYIQFSVLTDIGYQQTPTYIINIFIFENATERVSVHKCKCMCVQECIWVHLYI